MFQYTNTILVNSLIDEVTGLDRIVERTIDSNPALDIRRVNIFKKANVTKMIKRAATLPILGKAVFKVASADAGYYRLKLYIRLSGSQNSYYANDFVFKGKPLIYEYKIASNSTSGADVAKEIKRVIDHTQQFYGEKWLKVSTNGDQLTISGTDEYQLFTEARLQKLNAAANNALTNEVYEDIAQGTITPCREGFGTYPQIIKDLRLPTMENRRFAGINGDEVPVPGAMYNQYTIYYKVDRGLFGGAAVGQQVTSVTTHVFYVLTTISNEFETMLKKLGTLDEEKKPIMITGGVSDITLVKAGTNQDVTPTIAEGTKKWVDAETKVDWLTITPGEDKVGIAATDNDTGSKRITRINIVVTDETGAVATQSMTVTQSEA